MKYLLTILLLCSAVSAQKVGTINSSGSTCASATMDSFTSGPSNCVSVQLPPNASAASIVLAGTFSATLQFEVSADNANTWVAAPTASATSTGTFSFSLTAYTHLRVRASAYVSGSVSVTILSSGGSTNTVSISSVGVLTSLNGAFFAQPNTVQQTMTSAGVNGLSFVYPNYAGTDKPSGTHVGSLLNPTITTQPNGAHLIDYRLGETADSSYNCGYDSIINIWSCRQYITTWNQALGNGVSSPASGVNNAWSNFYQTNFLSGGQNINQNGYVNKSSLTDSYHQLNSWTNGQVNAGATSAYCYGQGDCLAYFLTGISFGGNPAGSDEGAEALDINVGQAYVEYSGTAVSPTTGATSLPITPTVGAGTQGPGRPLIDVTKGTTTGTITSISGTGVSAVVTFSGTAFTTSTITTTSAAITVTGNNTTPGSVNIQVGNSAGMLANDIVCIYDATTRECVKLTAVPDGTHITAVWTLPHASGATVSDGGVAANGPFGLVVDADTWTTSGQIGFASITVTQPLRQIWPVIGCTSGTSCRIWISVKGNASAYAGLGVFPGATYHLFPTTFTVDGTNNQTNTMLTEPNNIAWANGDTLSLGMFPTMQIGIGNWQIYRLNASQDVGGTVPGITYSGVPGNNDALWNLSFNPTAGNTIYTGHSGVLQPPFAFNNFKGLARYGMYLNVAPDVGAVHSDCPINAAGAQVCTGNPSIIMLDVKNNSAGSDNFYYNPTGQFWNLGFGNRTHFCAFGQTNNSALCDAGFITESTGVYAFRNGSFAVDTGMSRGSVAGRTLLGNGTAGDSSGTFGTAGYISQGTTFTASGCGNTTLVGGATAGKYTSVTAGSCSITITMGNSATAPNGWSCTANDITTSADAGNIHQTGGSQTTAILTEGTVVASDVINFACVGY